MAMFMDPIAQLSDEFDLQVINDVQSRLLEKINGLHREHDRKIVHNHVRTYARQLLLKLQNLRDMGATPQLLRQTGIETLRALETTSVNMIQEFGQFQTGSRELEQRYSAFDARVTAPVHTLSWAALSHTSDQNSPLMGAIGQYLITPSTDQSSVLGSVVQRVNRLAKVKSASPKIDERIQASFEGFLYDRAVERVATARVIAAPLNAIGNAMSYVVTESAAYALGCRDSEEGARNCRAVLAYVKKGAEKAEVVAKDVVTWMGAKPALKRMMSGNATAQRLVELGIDPASAQQYGKDCITIALHLGFAGGMIGADKLFRSAIPPIPKQRDILSPWQKNRKISDRTKIVPEDLGISSAEFSNYHRYYLDGWMTLSEKKVFTVRVELLMVPEGRLSNMAGVFSNIKKIAKVNGASTVQVETQIANKKLFRVMRKKFGEPLIEWRDQGYYEVFKIPVE